MIRAGGEWFKVFVGKAPKPGQPAMLGSFEKLEERLSLRAEVSVGTGHDLLCKAESAGPGQPIDKPLRSPPTNPDQPTKIAAVYPTGQKLPENLLRIYIHFSAPMSRGRSYRYLHLYRSDGRGSPKPVFGTAAGIVDRGPQTADGAARSRPGQAGPQAPRAIRPRA